MFRKPERNENELAKVLEKQVRKLEKFKRWEGLEELRGPLTNKETKELEKILTNLVLQVAPLEILLDRGIKDLEGYGMQFNEKTSRIENVFARYPTKKVVGGVSILDRSIFSPEENFGKVLKKAFGLNWEEGARTGMSRNQACDDMVEAYKRAIRESKEVETGFLLDVIDLRAKHQTILGAVYDILHSLPSEGIKKGNLERAESQLSSLITGLNEAVATVRKTDNYSHLMTAREFQSVSSILGFRRPEVFKKIDHELRILQEPPSSLVFWKKQVPLSNDQRSAHLETLKSFVEDAMANSDIDKRRKLGLEKLLPQIDYAIQKTWTAQMREKQQKKLASLKEPAPEDQSALRKA